MAILRLLLGDQLSRSVSSLRDACADDIILMAEVAEEASYVAHHQLKLVLIFSAMRHFAEGLAAEFPRLNYRRYDDNSHQVAASLFDAVEQLVATEQIEKVVLTEPGEYRLREVIKTWSASLGMPVEVREDDRFIASHDEFATWFSGRKQATMEYFYRGLRRRTGLLMRDGKPEGGKWNYDADNRKRLPKQQSVIEPLRFTPDEITREVIAMVVQNFSHHMGDAAAFFYAVTQDEAQQALDYFCRHHLPVFGDYQDAMHDQQAFVFHSLLSAYINIGLLNPLAVCEAAQAEFDAGNAPLNAVEGFIRQILGWREYMRGMYWQLMPSLASSNALQAQRPLPDFYWSGKTDMHCLSTVIQFTQEYAYSHHIQRLMVTGNFALLAGLDPVAVHEWYLAVYTDAFEWVEMPNTIGMALHADGGCIATKPYAASGAYIKRMSNFCDDCCYNVKEKTTDDACPFNYLYWNFLLSKADALRSNPRMRLAYKNLDRLNDDERALIIARSESFLSSLS